ncbi:MAG TPA: hypothetical protein VHJ38_20015 [Nitrososphaeraceae archaeon]|nr:hypothetical protein [Nitrososphaeraceae archaeon]
MEDLRKEIADENLPKSRPTGPCAARGLCIPVLLSLLSFLLSLSSNLTYLQNSTELKKPWNRPVWL